MTYRIFDVQTEVGRGSGLNPEGRTALSQAASIPGKIVYSKAFGAAIATTTAAMMTATPASSAVFEAPAKQPYLAKRFVNDTVLVSKGQSHLEDSLVALHNQSARALGALNARVDELAVIVGVLASRASDEMEVTASVSACAEQDITTLLDRACDAGILDDSVLALAEAAIDSEDKFERLAGLRAISLGNPERGIALIEAHLETESSAVIRSALQGTLKALA